MSLLLQQIANPKIADVQGAIQQKLSRGLAGQVLGNQLTGDLQQLAFNDPETAIKLLQATGVPLGEEREQRFVNDVISVSQMDVPTAMRYMQQRIAENEAMGIPSPNMRQSLMDMQTDPEAEMAEIRNMAQAFQIRQAPQMGVSEAEFERSIANLPPEQQQEARMIKLGLRPRAMGSAAQTIAAAGTAEEVGASEAVMAERKKFAEMQGSQRSQAIDKGFEKVQKISGNISNLDKAIAAVQQGAGTGAIERRFPSLRQASVALDQIQGELALDVIGSVTFGALSEGELDLAKQIALPAGLEGPALIEHLQARKSAQEKLLEYFQDQIDFLDEGGSVAGFLRMMRRREKQPAQQQTQQAPSGQQIGRFTVEVE